VSTGAVSASDSGGSGTRHAFLKPLPGERRHSSNGNPAPEVAVGETAWQSVREDDVLATLFPQEFDPQAADRSPGSVTGLRLGHFLIEERIGRGGMGAVFRAVDTRLDRVVALKVLSPAHSRDAASVQRFQNEARAAAHLDHENIARVHFIGEDRAVHFIAFEFVRGTNVRDFIVQKGVLSPQEAVNYTLQIAQALRHAQAAGVVHRDIKPSNIIVTPAGRAKLVDLGLARQEHTSPSLELTTAGTTLGTFDYIAPEQARDPRNVDIRADIYSLGCTLYHMLTGEPPFPQGGMIQKVVDHHRDNPPDPTQRNPRVSAGLSRVIRKMMASNPDERYATPDHLIHDLALVAHSLGLRQLHPDHLIWTVPQYDGRSVFWEQNRGWLLTVAMLIIIALGINQVPWEAFTNAPAAHSVANPPAPARPADEPLAPSANVAPSTSETAPPRPDVPPVAGFAEGMFRFEPSGISPFRPVDSGGELTTTPADIGRELAANLIPASASSVGSPSRTDTGVEQLLDDIDSINRTLSPIPGAAAPAGSGTLQPEAAAPLFVVMSSGGVEQSYATLEAACQEAPADATIELRFDGLCPVPQRPVRIQKKKLVIRAQKGKRPVVEFQASPLPGSNATRMITVLDGSLKLYDVGVVMSVQPGLVADRWAVFSLARTEALECRGVSVTIRNPQRRDAAVVEQTPGLAVDMERTMPDSMMLRLLVLDWKDSVLRGECDLLINETLEPVDVYFDNVAVAVSGTLLRMSGRELDARMPDNARFALRRLQHVTAVLGEGLVRIDTELYREFIPLEFDWRDSVIAVRPGQPLISMAGQQDVEQFRRSLTWRAESTWLDVAGPVWEIIPEYDAEQVLDYHALAPRGEPPLASNLLAQPVPWDGAEFASFRESDFALRSFPADPPQATDGSAAGVLWNSRMPTHETGRPAPGAGRSTSSPLVP
jgi:serine/threonine-protein kinase